MRESTYLLSLFALFAPSVLAYDAVFWYSPLKDECAWEGQTSTAQDNELHGGVCAYSADTNRIYACPAPDPYCWTWAQNCKAGTAKAGNNQILCSASGANWCCTADETCTITQDQINICISNFTSPNAKVNVNTANQKLLSAVSVSSITATTQRTDPTPFTTKDYFTSTSSSSSRSSSTSSRSSSTRTQSSSSTSSSASNSGETVAPSTASPSAANSQTTGDSTPSAPPSSSSLSSGVIAGVVIGVVAVLGLIAALFFFLGRNRRSNKAAPTPAPAYTDSFRPPPNYAYTSMAAQPPTGEINHNYGNFYAQKPSHAPILTEMPVHDSRQSNMADRPGVQRYELGP